MHKRIKAAVHECVCEKCAHRWITLFLPESCPNKQCRTREWNGKKERHIPKPHARVKLPKPTRVKPYNHEEK